MTIHVPIERSLPIPLYHQLKVTLLKMIESGDLGVGAPLPTERQLEATYGISRITVRKAIDELVSLRTVRRVQGVGTFVIGAPTIRHRSHELLSFSDEMRLRGLEPGSVLLNFSRLLPNVDEMAALRLGPGQEIFQIQRLRLANGEPIGLHTTYLPADRLPGLSAESLQANTSLYHLLARDYGIEVTRAVETLEASVASAAQAARLGVREGSPILIVERVAYSESPNPIELVAMIYRADRYKYYSTLSNQTDRFSAEGT